MGLNMDETYLPGRKPVNRTMIVVLIVVLAVLAGGVYLYLKGKQNIISPVPPEPSFTVIYYTPTPGPVTPSSTPSATLKPTKAPADTPIPRASATTAPVNTPAASPSASTTPGR